VEVYQAGFAWKRAVGGSAVPFGWGLPDSYSEYLEKRRLNFAKSISKIPSVFLQRAKFAP
jgi:hypothetical protein